MTDTYAPLHTRLMAQADRLLSFVEGRKPSVPQEAIALLRALIAAERLIRQLHTPLVKTKGRSTPSEPLKPASLLPIEPCEDGEEGASEATLTEGAAQPQIASDSQWRKGWSDKQAQLREQRAARTGKWPDGTPYSKTG
ncbi:hypothetical protein [Asticcacaulis sp. YBE204]|uniref:hypothetical protein n=1 Tax=Asticcacaulis sp. YBE204 TaxID=1282363 RepID=UPI0003C3AFE0|nr:hypothetical protein [Asticcacaulis sp. YBE204]ESQ77977.1 hypothetical protein AEYBE204_15895 [Asticcacaulis sp. YBE204]